MVEQNANFANWDEVRIAYAVARLGTLSAAAAYLGVHHATVIRNIDALEARLGVKLFQRHARGYTPTEAGRDLLAVAAATEDQLAQFAARQRGVSAEVKGDLIVTTIGSFSVWLTPVLAAFQMLFPDLRLSLLSDYRLLRLEHGEAHLAIRAGPKPQEPDNVVQHLGRFPITLFAHRDYVARMGPLADPERPAGHRFVGGVKVGALSPHDRWINAHVPEADIVFRTGDNRVQSDAVAAGIGIGFAAVPNQSNPDLVQVCPPRPEWEIDIWLVSHMALHRTAKVQALSHFLIDQVRGLVGRAQTRP